MSYLKNSKIIEYVRIRMRKIIKFLVVGGSAALLALLILYLLVNYFGLNSILGENIANLISMEIATIYNFFMMRSITWAGIPKEHGKNLLIQIIRFHVALIITTILRVVLFAFLQFLSVQYMLNAATGMLLAAALNFMAYDSMIFNKKCVAND